METPWGINRWVRNQGLEQRRSSQESNRGPGDEHAVEQGDSEQAVVIAPVGRAARFTRFRVTNEAKVES
jgi:hypothetical protein